MLNKKHNVKKKKKLVLEKCTFKASLGWKKVYKRPKISLAERIEFL